MKPTLLAGALGILMVGLAPSASYAQAKEPLMQPNSEAPANVPAGEAVIGTVRIPRGVKADGKEFPAGTYKVRVTSQEAAGKAPGATASYERVVEFLQGNVVKAREVATIVPNAEIGKVAKAKPPAPGTTRVERLRGDEFVRVWINHGGNHYLIHLPTAAA
jgi:hypothetical protein